MNAIDAGAESDDSLSSVSTEPLPSDDEAASISASSSLRGSTTARSGRNEVTAGDDSDSSLTEQSSSGGEESNSRAERTTSLKRSRSFEPAANSSTGRRNRSLSSNLSEPEQDESGDIFHDPTGEARVNGVTGPPSSFPNGRDQLPARGLTRRGPGRPPKKNLTFPSVSNSASTSTSAASNGRHRPPSNHASESDSLSDIDDDDDDDAEEDAAEEDSREVEEPLDESAGGAKGSDSSDLADAGGRPDPAMRQTAQRRVDLGKSRRINRSTPPPSSLVLPSLPSHSPNSPAQTLITADEEEKKLEADQDEPGAPATLEHPGNDSVDSSLVEESSVAGNMNLMNGLTPGENGVKFTGSRSSSPSHHATEPFPSPAAIELTSASSAAPCPPPSAVAVASAFGTTTAADRIPSIGADLTVVDEAMDLDYESDVERSRSEEQEEGSYRTDYSHEDQIVTSIGHEIVAVVEAQVMDEDVPVEETKRDQSRASSTLLIQAVLPVETELEELVAEIEEDAEDEVEEEHPVRAAARSKKNSRKKDKGKGKAVNQDLYTEEGATGDDRNGGETPAGSDHDEDDVFVRRRGEAIEALTRIEIEFARLRDRLYIERMGEVERERRAVENGTHPELLHLTRLIEARRQTKLELAKRLLDGECQIYRRKQEADEHTAWTSWDDGRAELRSCMLDEANSKRRKLDREKRYIDRAREDGLTPLLAPRSLPVVPLEHHRRIGFNAEPMMENEIAWSLRFTDRRIDASVSSLDEQETALDMERMGLREPPARPQHLDLGYGRPLQSSFQDPRSMVQPFSSGSAYDPLAIQPHHPLLPHFPQQSLPPLPPLPPLPHLPHHTSYAPTRDANRPLSNPRTAFPPSNPAPQRTLANKYAPAPASFSIPAFVPRDMEPSHTPPPWQTLGLGQAQPPVTRYQFDDRSVKNTLPILGAGSSGTLGEPLVMSVKVGRVARVMDDEVEGSKAGRLSLNDHMNITRSPRPLLPSASTVSTPSTSLPSSSSSTLAPVKPVMKSAYNIPAYVPRLASPIPTLPLPSPTSTFPTKRILHISVPSTTSLPVAAVSVKEVSTAAVPIPFFVPEQEVNVVMNGV